jgi:NAD(P)-dependent dehydrogenase (short-subunit alcohol dehydrogenase family)
VEREDALETKERVEKEGRRCLLVDFDLTDFRGAKSIVDEHMQAFGRLDVLINNASRQVLCKDLAKIDLGNSFSDQF